MTGWQRYTAQIAITILAVAASVGCVGDRERDYPSLAGHFAAEPNLEPLIADRAYLAQNRFYVRFRQGRDLFYGGGDWSGRIPIFESGDATYSGPYLLPLRHRHSEPWDSLPEDLIALRILDVNQWRSFRNRLFETLMPDETGQGVVIHFGVDDYFMYYDEARIFRFSTLDQKPTDYAIATRHDFEEVIEHGLPVLDAFLGEVGYDDRRIVFNTGDTGSYSLPFLYVNRDLPVAVFVRDRGPKREYVPESRPVAVAQTAGHLAESHTHRLLMRPLSSAVRLLFVATDTVSEAFRPSFLPGVDAAQIPPLADAPGMNLELWEAELDRLTGRKATRGTMRYLVDGEQFFTRLIDALSAAKSSINLRMYIFDNDDYALRIGELLKRRSNEGIDVKVLLDGLGTIVSTIEKQDSLPEGFTGPASVQEFLQSDSAVEVRQASNPWLTGDHVKTVTIDETLAFTGGMNIAREYRYDWHDMMVELSGPVVDRLQFEFEKAWAHAGPLGDIAYLLRRFGQHPRNASPVGRPLRVLYTRASSPEIFLAQLEAARRAQRYVYLQNAYFTDDAILYELAKARLRGVDVRVIMPLVTDRGLITKNNALAANALLEHGVRVFIFPGMSHVKAAVFDGWACLGSANLDRWSLRLNKELNIATSDPEYVQALEALLFEPDFERSVELTEPFPERWSDHLVEIVGDYIF